MKILELRFKNLNSLYGTWVIDFTDPAYAAEGIFTLTGPTGAGKSTILDAICLALYGATPRLKKITKSENEIMSRLTWECYSEVLFETREGRFRCHWVQRRARKNPSGNLQDYEHQIVDDVTQTVITAKRSEVPSVVEEKTGMDFTRFTRAILLAQGSFDSFLKADDVGKSLILEQITGTDIYSRISIAVYERNKIESEKLDSLKNELSGIKILDSIQEQELLQDLEAKQALEADISITLKKMTEAVSWLLTIESLNKEIAEIEVQRLKKCEEIEAFAPTKQKLQKAQLAASIEAIYSPVTIWRKKLADDGLKLESLENRLPELNKAAAVISEMLTKAEKLSSNTRDEINNLSPVWNKVRLLDQQIGQKSSVISELSESYSKDSRAIEEKLKEKVSESQKCDTEHQKLGMALKYLEEHAPDEMLLQNFEAMVDQCRNIIELKDEIALKASEIKKTEKAAVQWDKELETFVKERVLKEKEIEETINKQRICGEELRQILGEKLLREFRAEKDALHRERELRIRIASLEKHRLDLEDGIACPLCGSLEHPYASGNVPQPDEINQQIENLTLLINKAEGIEEIIHKLQLSETEARNFLSSIIKRESDGRAEQRAVIQKQDSLKQEVENLKAKEEKLIKDLTQKLSPLGVFEFDVKSLPDILRNRKTAFENQFAIKVESQKRIDFISGEIRKLIALIENLENMKTEKGEQLKLRKDEIKELETERMQEYGSKNPAEEESRLKKLLEQAFESERNVRTQLDLKKLELTEAITQIDSLKKGISSGWEELKKCAEEFNAALAGAGFATENEFLEAILPPLQRSELAKKDDALKSALTELDLRKVDRETRLEMEKERKLVEKNALELKENIENNEKALTDLREVTTNIKILLRENEEAKRKMSSRISVLKAQENEAAKWYKLYTLIGAKDGKKFRQFAQGLTFEILAGHANEQLKNMTDRYLLVRDVNKPLELNVIDNYQAGETRSIKNLSGGESFIVSLALALGLSQMSSGKILVESLFLDEGFGTLDDEALESALETLSTLQQSGKLIGIISHLSVLKERISTTIKIVPVAAGRSIISGPGCKNLETVTI